MKVQASKIRCKHCDGTHRRGSTAAYLCARDARSRIGKILFAPAKPRTYAVGGTA